MKFSLKLSSAMLAIITDYNAERGCEEIVGDNLQGDNLVEFNNLVEKHGFEAVTAEIKRKFQL